MRKPPEPYGRIDILAYRLAERELCQLHPIVQENWDRGLGAVVEQIIRELLPSKPVLDRKGRLCS